MGLLARVRKEWFIIGIVAAIVSAKLQPAVGLKGGVDQCPPPCEAASVCPVLHPGLLPCCHVALYQTTGSYLNQHLATPRVTDGGMYASTSLLCCHTHQSCGGERGIYIQCFYFYLTYFYLTMQVG
uniref:Solute carrier family 10 member 7 n=1 Tax=Oncorhynchus mykiss TaxID=8022 RepID=A0A8K9V5T2_ONCMY